MDFFLLLFQTPKSEPTGHRRVCTTGRSASEDDIRWHNARDIYKKYMDGDYYFPCCYMETERYSYSTPFFYLNNQQPALPKPSRIGTGIPQPHILSNVQGNSIIVSCNCPPIPLPTTFFAYGGPL